MATESFDNAKANKKDEFYTQLTDIELEVKHYRDYFKDKIVFCNCDDPYESNFFKYFVLNFNRLHLKRLVCTCYDGSPVAGQQLDLFSCFEENDKKAYKIMINEVKDYNGDGAVDLSDVEYLLKNDKNVLTLLKGNGDFRSEECIELLKECDVVVTNPPFSLFRQYMSLLLKYDKKFLIIGNQNAISYKEIFPLIQQNKLWLGQSIHSGDREFRVPDTYPLKASGYRVDENGVKYIRIKGVRWFTNLDNMNRHEVFVPYKNYDPLINERYDNYDAINVDVSADIPCDYDGLMGVPITFLDKYNPDQFEIIGILKSPLGNHLRTKVYPKQVQHKVGQTKTAVVTKLNDGPAIIVSIPPTKKDDVYYTIGDVIYVSRYARLLIRRK